MDEIKILQLSDLHFGNDSFSRSLARKRWWWKTEDEKLLKNLEKAIYEIEPDYVLITGDIVNKCDRPSFKHAAERLRTLFANAAVDVKKDVLVIPGNHDVTILPEQHEYLGRADEFCRFLRIFFDESDYRSRTTNFVKEDAERKLCFVCLDSTLKDRIQMAEGEVGTGQWDWFERKMKKLMNRYPQFDTFVKIVVLHHHLYEIRASGQGRFMQLLDAGRAEEMFEKYDINIVLHGHKHFPNEKRHDFDAGRHYTVVAAGTATCPFPEEQCGEGNSFNLLRIKRTANLLEVERYRANNDKEYVRYGEPRRFPLFPPSETGYKMQEFSSITKIRDTDGNCLVTHARIGLVVEKEGVELAHIAFGMRGSTPEAEIHDLDYDTTSIAEIKYETKQKDRVEGYFVLRNKLCWGSDPRDLWFTAEVLGTICMKRSEYPKFYPGKTGYAESVDLQVIHPCDQLSLAVEFPRKYTVNPRPEAKDQNGIELDLRPINPTFQPDRLANRYTLVVRKPQLRNVYSIVWEVPE